MMFSTSGNNNYSEISEELIHRYQLDTFSLVLSTNTNTNTNRREFKSCEI